MNEGRLRVLILWLSDIVCVSCVWALVATVYRWTGLGSYHASYYLYAWPVPIVFTLVNVFGKLYHGRYNYPAMPVPQVEEFRRLVLSSVATHILVMAVLGFSRDVELVSRFVLSASGILVAMLSQPFRDIARMLMKRFGAGQIPVYLVGDGEAADGIAATLRHDPYYGMNVVRRFGRDEFKDVVKVAEKSGVKHLIACYRDNRLLNVQFGDFVSWFTFIEYIPTAESIPIADARAIQVGGLGGMEMVNQRRMKLLSMEKSIVDRLLAIGIFLLSCPLFVIVPILIKLTSKGPVFYRAKRLGKHGRTIYVWKFRSMYADADRRLESLLAANPDLAREFAADFKLKHDPRITPLGKFLRKTSIDELPQLINVFTHEMSLIGPRPIVEKEVEKYGRHYEIFSSVKPGITGLWQASGRNNVDYAQRVAMDVHYVLNWSPWMDLWIVLKTPISVLGMRGSY